MSRVKGSWDSFLLVEDRIPSEMVVLNSWTGQSLMALCLSLTTHWLDSGHYEPQLPFGGQGAKSLFAFLLVLGKKLLMELLLTIVVGTPA